MACCTPIRRRRCRVQRRDARRPACPGGARRRRPHQVARALLEHERARRGRADRRGPIASPRSRRRRRDSPSSASATCWCRSRAAASRCRANRSPVTSRAGAASACIAATARPSCGCRRRSRSGCCRWSGARGGGGSRSRRAGRRDRPQVAAEGHHQPDRAGRRARARHPYRTGARRGRVRLRLRCGCADYGQLSRCSASSTACPAWSARTRRDRRRRHRAVLCCAA